MLSDFDKRVIDESYFLVNSSKKYLEKLKIFLSRLDVENFLKTLGQLQRAFGEILGLTKYMQENIDKFKDIYDEVMFEIQSVLKETFIITKKFIIELKKKLNNAH